MMNNLKLVIFLAYLFTPHSSLALTTNELIPKCEQFIKAINGDKNTDAFEGNFCAAYINGTDDTNSQYFNITTDKKTIFYCKPNNTTYGQLARIFLKYAKNLPEYHHYQASDMLLLALKKAFPCS